MERLGDLAAGAQSPLELRYLKDVERAHGLPPGVRQPHAGDTHPGDKDPDPAGSGARAP